MRWSPDRAQRVIHLRCILVNGQREAFERFVTERAASNLVRLGARPTPTVPHDTKPKSLKRAA